MSGFSKHGLDHTSASQINMWEECPAAWVARYLYDKKFKFGVAPQIGTLVENVVASVLLGRSFEESLKEAEKHFLKDNALNTNEKDMARVSDIGAMAGLALDYLKPLGEPEFISTLTGHEQQRITVPYRGDGWELPIIGYLDFVYPKHGLIIDLKTTLRCPSSFSAAHARQAAVYQSAMPDMRVEFLYCTPKKHNVIELEDYEHVMKEIYAILNRQERMLWKLRKEELVELVPLGLSSFYWSDNEDIREELYKV